MKIEEFGGINQLQAFRGLAPSTLNHKGTAAYKSFGGFSGLGSRANPALGFVGHDGLLGIF